MHSEDTCTGGEQHNAEALEQWPSQHPHTVLRNTLENKRWRRLGIPSNLLTMLTPPPKQSLEAQQSWTGVVLA